MFYSKSKTFTHLRESIFFYKDALLANLSSKEKQMMCLNCLYNIWNNSNVYFKYVFELLIESSFIDYSSATTWIIEKLKKSMFIIL